MIIVNVPHITPASITCEQPCIDMGHSKRELSLPLEKGTHILSQNVPFLALQLHYLSVMTSPIIDTMRQFIQ